MQIFLPCFQWLQQSNCILELLIPVLARQTVDEWTETNGTINSNNIIRCFDVQEKDIRGLFSIFYCTVFNHTHNRKWGAVVQWLAGLPLDQVTWSSIPSMVFFTHQSSSAVSKLKSLRSAHWQWLSLLRAVFNWASYSQGKTSEQWRTSRSAAGLMELSYLQVVALRSKSNCNL